jgi:hypothetical protein
VFFAHRFTSLRLAIFEESVFDAARLLQRGAGIQALCGLVGDHQESVFAGPAGRHLSDGVKQFS